MAVLGLSFGLLAIPAVRAETAAAFIQRASAELIAANKAASVTSYAAALRRYGDVTGIGTSALGSYASRLSRDDRPLYYNGMVNFIARYAAKESPKYQVTKATVLGQSDEDSHGANVETRIYLRSGDTYDVRWELVRSGQSFKIRDAQVLGFGMTSALGTLFQNYITENGGNSKALIRALNR